MVRLINKDETCNVAFTFLIKNGIIKAIINVMMYLKNILLLLILFRPDKTIAIGFANNAYTNPEAPTVVLSETKRNDPITADIKEIIIVSFSVLNREIKLNAIIKANILEKRCIKFA